MTLFQIFFKTTLPKLISNIGISLFFLIAIFLKPSDLLAGDIKCTCNDKRYDLPGECLNSGYRGSLAKPMCGCALDPQSAALKNDSGLNQAYNQAVFRRPGVMPQLAAEVVLVAYIVNKYYKPHNSQELKVAIGECEGWAEVSNKPVNGKYILTVSPDLFYLSPAMLVSTLGHEMVHLTQYQKGSKISNISSIDFAVSAFRELEASNWNTGKTNYAWDIGPNKLYGNLLTKENHNEKQEVDKTLEYREWQIKKAIQDCAEWRTPTRLNTLESWLKENPWTSQYWLPANPNWKTYKTGAKPEGT